MTTTSASNDRDPATPPGKLETARTTITDTAGAAKNATADALAAARDKAGTAFEDARDTAADLSRRAANRIDDNPVAALIGGLAFGALAAALLPRTEREVAAFGSIGSRLTDTAREAADAAKAAGKEKLDELGLSQARAQDTVSKLFSDVAKAATSAGTAAVSSARGNAGTEA